MKDNGSLAVDNVEVAKADFSHLRYSKEVAHLPSHVAGDGHCELYYQVPRKLSGLNEQYYSVKYWNWSRIENRNFARRIIANTCIWGHRVKSHKTRCHTWRTKKKKSAI